MRELKKVSREKSSKKEMDDITKVKEEYSKMMEVHSNMEAKLASIAVGKQALEEKFKRLYDEHESLKTSESLLRKTAAGMKAANGILETKTNQLSLKNKEYKQKIEMLEGRNKVADKVNEEKE